LLVVMALVAIVLIACALKIATIENFHRAPVWAIYSIAVTTFILSRFGLAWFYRPHRGSNVASYRPTIAIIVPAYNEQYGIAATLRACLSVDYPADRLRVIVVDDRSTDATLARIREVKAQNPELTVIAADVNRGKRHAIAAGIDAAADAEIFVFIDSDSLVERHAIANLVQYFADPRVGAATGHADVLNKDTNVLTRMQAVQYYISFRVYKSAEALFGSVTCCSGCFSGYRRTALDPVLSAWLSQRFLGQPCTYGDDRSLTNFLLPHWRIVYAPNARAVTTVPDRMRPFLRQQLRWKKSWARESLRASRIMWRKNPIMAVSYYASITLPLAAPQIVFRALVVRPHFTAALPVWYLGGVLAVALFYGLYYRLYHAEKNWYHGIFFTVFYTVILVLQLPYALATIRDPRWGTR
jgi:hyaluronan synthase